MSDTEKFMGRPRLKDGWSSAEISVEAWDQWAAEPDLWYTRFHMFLKMGPKRSILGAYKLSLEDETFTDGTPVLTSVRPGQAWWRMQKEWNWRERAQKFDLANIEDWRENYSDMLALIRTESIEVGHETRDMVDEILMKVVAIIDTILSDDDSELSLKQSVDMLRPLISLRSEMEKSMRLWMGEATDITGGNQSIELADSVKATLDKVFGGGEEVKESGGENA